MATVGGSAREFVSHSNGNFPSRGRREALELGMVTLDASGGADGDLASYGEGFVLVQFAAVGCVLYVYHSLHPDAEKPTPAKIPEPRIV
jgi:hypothetical protein